MNGGAVVANQEQASVELVVLELDDHVAVSYVDRCADRGLTVSEGLERTIKNFLAKGDNHRAVMRAL